MHHVIEYDEECPDCKGTGLYIGFGEHDGAAVECRTCHGTGCNKVKLEYDDFEKRKVKRGVVRVYKVNPGIGIGTGKDKSYKLEDFGGMPYYDWHNGEPFPAKSEMRNYVCPAWWYQNANYKLKPNWKECSICGSFIAYPTFPNIWLCF